jgi:hypothetical protein
MTALMTGYKGKFHQVDPVGLSECATPKGTTTWEPVKHGWLYLRVRDAIRAKGFRIGREDLQVNRDGKEFFGILNLEPPEGLDWGLSVGIRNTNNKRASAGVCLGTNVIVCDNLQFTAEHVLLRKHHVGTYDVLDEGVIDIMRHLPEFQAKQEEKVAKMKARHISAMTRDHLLVNCMRVGAIRPTQVLPIIQETKVQNSKNPDAFGTTIWALYNGVTWVTKPDFLRNPDTAASRSIRMNREFHNLTVV